MDQVYGNVNLRYAAETEQEEEAKGLKKIDRGPALSCITDTVCILTSKLPELEKKAIADKILAAPARRRPQFDYLEKFKDEMQHMLEQVSQKEYAVNLKKELIEEQHKEARILIEA